MEPSKTNPWRFGLLLTLIVIGFIILAGPLAIPGEIAALLILGVTVILVIAYVVIVLIGRQ